VQEGDSLGQTVSPNSKGGGPHSLVGRPLSDVERYYIEQALEVTNGNRDQAARMLGIGERTLYRNIQQWKLQDEVKKALADAGGKLLDAAKVLGIKESELQRKLKRWGITTDGKE
jgi:DNA-binding NtrC family response regulator